MLKRIIRNGSQLTFDMGNFQISLSNVGFRDEGIDRMIGLVVANRKYLVTRKEMVNDILTVHVSFFPTNYYPYLHLKDFLMKVDATKPIKISLPTGVVSYIDHIHQVLGEVENKVYLFRRFLPEKEATNI